MRRKVCVVTGTRAEYGLLRGIIEGVRRSPALELQLLVTGTHLAPEFGCTVAEIEADGHPIAARVEMLLSGDTASAVTKSMGLGLIGFADAFERLRPDIVVVLGDRYEAFAAAAAALVARVPIAHVHGGETTEGAYDEAFRHSITKMATLHFVAAEPYRQRVIQLGEAPRRVFLAGGLGVDAIARVPLLDRSALEASLGVRFAARNLLVTFHPATLDGTDSLRQIDELFGALDGLPDTELFFTLPNADTQGRALGRRIEAWCAERARAHCFASLGQQRYLSMLAVVDGVVGNSSSGLAEAPSMRTGTVDIGDRQRGRLKAASVIGSEPDRRSIAAALATLYSPAFRAGLATVRNPYGEPGAAARIVAELERFDLLGGVKKAFHDLPAAAAEPA